MIDREHVFGLRNEAGEGVEDIAGVWRGEGRPLPRRASTVGLVDVAGRIGG